MHNVFVTRQGSRWTYSGIDSLRPLHIGVVQGYDYGSSVQPYINHFASTDRVTLMTGDNPLPRLIGLLKSQRIDVLLEDESVFRYCAARQDFSDFRIAGDEGQSLTANNLYIAFSPRPESRRYARILSQGMQRLRASGELQTILQRYGLNDWKTEAKGLGQAGESASSLRRSASQ